MKQFATLIKGSLIRSPLLIVLSSHHTHYEVLRFEAVIALHVQVVIIAGLRANMRKGQDICHKHVANIRLHY